MNMSVLCVPGINEVVLSVSPQNSAHRDSWRIWYLISCHSTGPQVTAESLEHQ